MEADSVEFVIDDQDEDVKLAVRPLKVERPIKIEEDLPQLGVGLAAISLRPPPSTASTSSDKAGPSHRTAALCRIPERQLGSAVQPCGRGRPKGSKSRPRIALGLSTPPERTAKNKAEAEIAKMLPSKHV